MEETTKIELDKIKPGSKFFGSLNVAERIDGSPIRIPFVAVNGKQRGPKMWIIAGTHGDEVAAMVAVQKIVNLVDPRELKGTLLAIPVAVPAAFEAGEKFSPLDNKDLQYCFPGDPEGTYTERIAHTIFQALTSNLTPQDCVLALHGGGTGRLQCPHVFTFQTGKPEDLEIDRKCRDIAEATGIRVVQIAKRSTEPLGFESAVLSGRRKYSAESVGGTIKGDLSEELRKLRVANVTVEAGGEAKARESDVNLHIQAVQNVMKHTDMMEGDPIQPSDKVYVSESLRVVPSKRGFWHPKVEPGDMISEGDVVAVVTDVFGREIETLRSPFYGIVLIVRYRTKIDPLSSNYKEFYGILVGKVED